MIMMLSMEDRLLQFNKFIIKRIVNTVDYNSEKDEYIINRISISDDVLEEIFEEGQRYGLSKTECVQVVNNVSDNIITEPDVNILKGHFDLRSIAIGQHLRINILHPEKGPHYIELLVTNRYHFYVLASDIVGIRYGDEIHALDGTWSNGYYADFRVTFGNDKHLNENLILRLGKLQSVEMFSPSVVHEILDSESSFTYDSLNAIQGRNVVDKCKNIKYYFWIPNKYKPITFIWREGDVQDEKSPFIIIENEDVPEAKITINKAFHLPADEKVLNTLIEIIYDCCKWRNAFNGIDNLKYVKPVKSGVVKRVESDLGYKEWVLISQPQIKFVYE